MMLTIKDSTYFAPDKIADSGQLFRADQNENEVHFVSGGEYASVKKAPGGWDILTTNDGYFHNYFDWNTDYSKIESALNLSKNVTEAGRGLRILRADFIETVISFIISANNNIKRIKKTAAALCERYGERKTFGDVVYYAFPTLKKLLTINVDNWQEIGCGYRSPYLVKAVNQLRDVSFNNLNKLDNKDLYKEIIKLDGVGPKVAGCIMLFAFHRLDVVPVDVHIKRAIEQLGEKADAVFNNEYGGVAQQYIFYYLQHLRKKLD